MKCVTVLSLLAIVASASCRHVRLQLLPWDEEGCHHAAGLRKPIKLKHEHCASFSPARSFQLSNYKRIEKYSKNCEVLVGLPISSHIDFADQTQYFDGANCRGQQEIAQSILETPNVCQNATFPARVGIHSARSAKLTCRGRKPNADAATPRSSTLVEIPLEISLSTTLKTVFQPVTIVQTQKAIALSTTSASTSASVVHSFIIPPPLDRTVTKTLTTTTSPRSTVYHIASPSPRTSTKTILVSASKKSPSTTETFCWTTAFKGQRPQPTKRSTGAC